MTINLITFEITAYGNTYLVIFNGNLATVKTKGINTSFYEYSTNIKSPSGAAAKLILEQALLKNPNFKKPSL